MSNDNNNEDIEWQEHVKSKLSVKKNVLFAVLGCICLLLAWWTTYVAEWCYAPDYSNTRAAFFFVIFLGLFATPLYKIWAGFCLGVCFILCLRGLCGSIALMLLYVRIKKREKPTLSVSRIAVVLCIISVVISVAVIALGIWIAVRLSLIGNS